MKTQKQQGFTIIEVVLVLAIAGLIFLMVFIALPALQRNQRDTQRTNDVGRVVTAVADYQRNSKGKVPTDQTSLASVQSILTTGGDNFADPSEGAYDLRYSATAPGDPSGGSRPVHYADKTTCGDNGAVTTGQGARKFTVRVKLENGQIYCAGN